MHTQQLDAMRQREIKRLQAQLENDTAMIASSERLIAKFARQGLDTSMLERQRVRFAAERERTELRLSRLQEVNQ